MILSLTEPSEYSVCSSDQRERAREPYPSDHYEGGKFFEKETASVWDIFSAMVSSVCKTYCNIASWFHALIE